MRTGAAIKWAGASLLVLAMLAAVAAAGLIANAPPGALEARAIAEASAALGRPVQAARVETAWWPAPLVTLHDVTAARAPGRARPGLLTARRVTLHVAPWPLAIGSVRLARVDVDAPRLIGEGDFDELAGWDIATAAGGGPELRVAGGSGILTVSVEETPVPVVLDGLRVRWPGHGPAAVRATGALGGVAFSLNGHWRAGADGQHLEITSGSLGSGRISGAVIVAPCCRRARIAATLALDVLDLDGVLDRLAGVDWGIDQADANDLEPAKMFSDRRFRLGALRALDVELVLRAGSTQLRGIETGETRVELTLSDGVLEVERADARMGPGRVALRARIDWLEREYRLSLSGADIPTASLGLSGPFNISQGNVSLALNLEAEGRDAREIASSLVGAVELDLAGGWLDKDASELVTAVFPWTRDRRGLVIERASARATVDKGMLETATARITTPEVALAAVGMIDLASESLYLDLVPTIRDAEVAGQVVPLILSGPLAQPALLPNPGGDTTTGDDGEQ